MAGELSITQVRSLIGATDVQRRTVQALGLRRMHHSVTKPDRPEIRGMLARVSHLVEVRDAGRTDPGERAQPAGTGGTEQETGEEQR
jgi:large subunit ribosomal protein L30